MKYISHRGNLNGPVSRNENNPFYIDAAIFAGYEVEIDLRTNLGQLYLGHDDPDHFIDLEWLKERKDNLWIHCKDYKSLETCVENDLHCFFHNMDDYTMTSKGFVWGYPGTPKVSDCSILVLPEKNEGTKYIKDLGYFGICSDYIEEIRDNNVKTN